MSTVLAPNKTAQLLLGDTGLSSPVIWYELALLVAFWTCRSFNFCVNVLIHLVLCFNGPFQVYKAIPILLVVSTLI